MQQISTKKKQQKKKKKHTHTHKNLTRLDREGDPLGIVQEILIWPYEQMLFA